MTKLSEKFLIFSSLCFLLLTPSTFAAWVWSPEAGKFVRPDAAVQDTPQEQYEYAMEFYKKKDVKEAADQLHLLLKRYPASRIAPEAQYQLGVIYEEAGDYHKAFRAYRELLARYPQSERVNQAVQRTFRIGNLFLSGRKAKVLGLQVLPSGPRAVEVFKHLTEVAPYSEYGPQAQFHLGLAFKKMNQFEPAIEAFQTLIDRYSKHELVPQARFQIADTSYLQSVVASRDQRVMDRAREEIDRFLTRYPDSSVSDKAARLRHEIDEKNAEKNYRIARFYEKENLLDSALIYYRDVSARYPHTQWGQKAASHLQALEKPAEFLKAQAAEVASKKEALLAELQAMGDSDPQRKKALKEELKRLEAKGEAIEESKSETLKRRRAALHQKEEALKERRKALQKKRKKYAGNPSEDLKLAFERWEASLNQEEHKLELERVQLEEWERSLGVSESLYARWIPFAGEKPSFLEQVRRLEAERLEEIAKTRKELWEEKQELYQEYEKWTSLEGAEASQETPPSKEAAWEKLEAQALEAERLEKTLSGKKALYEEKFGTPAWREMTSFPTKVVGRSLDFLNPFDGPSRDDWESRSLEELEALETQWQEKAAAQKELVDVIGRAFDHELARSEGKRLAEEFPTAGDVDASELRRQIKRLEREIRSHYNEIQDRNERKKELIEELARALKQEKERGGLEGAGRTLTAPLRGAYFFGRSFLFGLPEREVELTREAERLSQKEAEAFLIRRLKEEIELESLLIETRNQEMIGLRREVERLRAQASFVGGPSFRSLLVKFPYLFIREAVRSANHLVPQKERKEKLIEQLHKETAKLEQYQREVSELQSLTQEKKSPADLPLPKEPAPGALETAPVAPSDPRFLQEEIQTLEKQLEVLKADFERQKEAWDEARWKELAPRQGKSFKALKGVEEDLVRLLEEERKIYEEEQAVLAKKQEKLEQFLEDPPSDFLTQELDREREQIESRLIEIQSRISRLGEELKRFRPHALPPT